MNVSKRNRILATVGLALAAILAYGPSLFGGFVWDDQILIVGNPSIQSWDHVGAILTKDFFHLHDEALPYGYYRPIISLSYLVEYQLWGLKPFGYHATNVLLHAIGTVLVALLLRRLRFGDGLSFTVALLFAIHPIHTENVVWIAGRTDLFAFVLTGTAFLLHLVAAERSERGDPEQPAGARASRSSAVLVAVSAGLFGLGLLAKEMSVVLIPWLALALRLLHRRAWRRIGVELSPYLLVFAAYCVLRFVVLDIEVPEPSREHSVSLALLSAAPTVLRYLGWMVLPTDLSAYVQNPYVTSLDDPRLLGSLLALALLGVLVWRFLRRPEERLLVGLLLTSFLPILNLVRVAGPADMGNSMSERFCYFPSFPFLALLVLLVGGVLGEARRSRRVQVAGLGLLVVLVALGTAQTVRRTREWRDDFTFVTVALEQRPQAWLLWKLMALCRMKRALGADNVGPEDQWKESGADLAELRGAADAYRMAARLNPADSGSRHNLGAALYRLDDLEGAIAAFREAVRIKPSYAKAYINLGAALQEIGQNDSAIEQYRTAIEVLAEDEPSDSEPASEDTRFQIIDTYWADLAAVHYNLGRALLERGDPDDRDEALRVFREAVVIRPDLIGALVSEAVARARGGDVVLASAILAEAVSIQPEYVPARNQYARALASLGRFAEAKAEIREGLERASAHERESLLQVLSSIEALEVPQEHPAIGEEG